MFRGRNGILNFLPYQSDFFGHLRTQSGNIHRIPDESRKSGYRIIGDVKHSEVDPLCSWVTPVPGGVGPLTIISLLENTMKAYKKNLHLQ